MSLSFKIIRVPLKHNVQENDLAVTTSIDVSQNKNNLGLRDGDGLWYKRSTGACQRAKRLKPVKTALDREQSSDEDAQRMGLKCELEKVIMTTYFSLQSY